MINLQCNASKQIILKAAMADNGQTALLREGIIIY